MKTVPIRIAVAVAKNGSFSAHGYHNTEGKIDPDECLSYSIDGVMDCIDADVGEFHVVFVEADVPLPPESVVVRGEVAE